MFAISFIINFMLEQIDNIAIDKYLNILLGATIGIIKGIVIITLLIFVFDTTPIEKQTKVKFYEKIELKSLFFKQCNDLKKLLFQE